MVSILHLSDIHLKQTLQKNELLFAAKIAAATLSQCGGTKEVILVITGDIVQSGKNTEYVNAKIFLDTIIKNFSDNSVKCKIWLTPGNHDCDFSNIGHVREILLSSIQKDKSKVDDDVISSLLKPQENYREFALNYEKTELLNQLVGKYSATVSQQLVVGISLNSAWMSQIKETPGTLTFPPTYFKSVEEVGLRICFFHHTVNWFDPNSSRIINEFIKTNFDIVLTGHEHISGTFKKIDNVDKIETHFLEGAALFEHNSDTSSFNILQVDISNKKYLYTNFLFDQKDQIYRKNKEADVPFLRTKHQQLQKFAIGSDFNTWLDDMGFAFQHSQKDPLNLSDVFVCPDFEVMKLQGKSSQNPYVKSESFFKEHEVNAKLIVVGPKESGKTALGKQIFLHHRSLDRAVLFIKGGKLNRKFLADGHKLQEQLCAIIDDQYTQFDIDYFMQLPLSQKAIVIDDFHLSELNYQGKQKFLKSLESIFGYVVVLADEVFKYEELLVGSTEANIFDSFKLLTIKPFGKRLKNQLIKKWTLLGRENAWEYQDWIRFQEQLFDRLESVLENKSIISYPLYILTLLQQIEAGTPAAAMSGSHGYLYDYLIHAELSKVFKSSSLINAIDTYLSHFCYWYFDQGKKWITSEEFNSFHDDYTKKFGSTLRADFVLNNLATVGVLNITDSSISIRRKYYTAYYASLRFAELLTLDQEALKSKLHALAQKAYLEDVSSFFSCLFYHTTLPVVRDVVNQFATTIFQKYEAFDFDTHTQFMKEIGYELHKELLDVDDEDIEKNRNSSIESIEQKNSNTKDFSDEDFKQDDPTNISIQINLSFKLMHILGQMLKAHQGKVEREEQKQVAVNCFNLGLRSLTFISNFLKDNKDEILNFSQSLFKDAISSSDATEKAKKFFYFLMQAISTSFIERVSSSVGAEELQVIFKDVITEKGGIGYSLIDFSINLTYKKDFPVEYLMDQADLYEKNQFAFDTLRMIVVKHLHVNMVDYKRKSQIANKLKLTTKTMQKALTSSRA